MNNAERIRELEVKIVAIAFGLWLGSMIPYWPCAGLFIPWSSSLYIVELKEEDHKLSFSDGASAAFEIIKRQRGWS